MFFIVLAGRASIAEIYSTIPNTINSLGRNAYCKFRILKVVSVYRKKIFCDFNALLLSPLSCYSRVNEPTQGVRATFLAETRKTLRNVW